MLMMTAYWWAKLDTRLGCELERKRHLPPLSIWAPLSSPNLCQYPLVIAYQGPATKDQLPRTGYSALSLRFLLSPSPNLYPKNESCLTAIIRGQKLMCQPLIHDFMNQQDFQFPLQGTCVNPQFLQCARCTHSWPGHLRTFTYIMTKDMNCLKNLLLKSISLEEGFFQCIFFFRVWVLGQKKHWSFLLFEPRSLRQLLLHENQNTGRFVTLLDLTKTAIRVLQRSFWKWFIH